MNVMAESVGRVHRAPLAVSLDRTSLVNKKKLYKISQFDAILKEEVYRTCVKKAGRLINIMAESAGRVYHGADTCTLDDNFGL